jgi:hypothetical protein
MNYCKSEKSVQRIFLRTIRNCQKYESFTRETVHLTMFTSLTYRCGFEKKNLCNFVDNCIMHVPDRQRVQVELVAVEVGVHQVPVQAHLHLVQFRDHRTKWKSKI